MGMMDGHQLGNKVLEVWRERFREEMISGDCKPSSVPEISVHVNTEAGLWQAHDVYFDPAFGIVIDARIKQHYTEENFGVKQ